MEFHLGVAGLVRAGDNHPYRVTLEARTKKEVAQDHLSYLFKHAHVHVYVSMYVHTHVRMFVCRYVRTYVCICVYMYVRTNVRM